MDFITLSDVRLCLVVLEKLEKLAVAAVQRPLSPPPPHHLQWLTLVVTISIPAGTTGVA